MEFQNQVIELLERIDENQLKGLAVQELQIAYTKAQLDRSERSISESIGLQRLAVARQAQIRNLGLPVIAVLLVLLGYLLVKWRVL